MTVLRDDLLEATMKIASVYFHDERSPTVVPVRDTVESIFSPWYDHFSAVKRMRNTWMILDNHEEFEIFRCNNASILSSAIVGNLQNAILFHMVHPIYFHATASDGRAVRNRIEIGHFEHQASELETRES